MDPRLGLAIDASVAWYDDVFALNALPCTRSDELWRALADPPPFHSAVKTLAPCVSTDRVLEAAALFDGYSVADSFGDLDLPRFRLLLEARWLHIQGGSAQRPPHGWSEISSPEALGVWSERHDYVVVLPSETLTHPRFKVLGRHLDGELVAGAVLHDAGTSIGLSNTWSAPGQELDWHELLAAAHAFHPDRALTGYAWGDELRAMVAAGFEQIGPQRVWEPDVRGH